MTRRYFLVKVITEVSVSGEQFGKALTDSVRRYFGEIGLSQIEPKLIRFDSKRSEAIIACKATKADELQAAVALSSDELEPAITPLILRVSGTIKGLGSKKQRQRF